MRFRLLSLIVVLTLLSGGQLSRESANLVLAQDGDSCRALLTQAVPTVCVDTPRGQVCYANTGVTVEGDGSLADSRGYRRYHYH